ncbi:hypothetical protein ABAC402_15560 [Asticcacaulis sp. AC402]|nr:hypothetical protein ABAC402_15560 [Asticcacaulis sp. AC402]
MLLASAAGLSLLHGAHALAADFNVPAQPAKTSIPEFANQAKIQIIAPVSQLEGVNTPAVIGDYDTMAGLTKLISGTRLEVASQRNGVIALRVSTASATESISASASEAAEPEIVIITGFRGSIYKSARIKRAATNIVDSVVAEDIGKLPDTNVAEALSRIPGVAVGRDKGEGRTITVRGLGGGFNVTTMNGRRIASEFYDREFNYDMLGADVASRIDVNKSPLARLPEGGIGAVVDIQTWRPFDLPDNSVVVSAFGVYDEYADKYNPRVSGLWSKQFAGGTLGIALGVNYNKYSLVYDQASVTEYDRDFKFHPSDPVSATLPPNTAFTLPKYLTLSHQQEERERYGASFAVQWKPAENVELNIDGLLSNLSNTSVQDTLGYGFDQGNRDYFGSSTVVSANIVGGNVLGMTLGATPGARNPFAKVEYATFSFPRVSRTGIIGANLAWQATSSLKLSVDASYSRAEQENDGDNWELKAEKAVRNMTWDWTSGDLPDVTLSEEPGTNFPIQFKSATTAGNAVSDEITELRFQGEWNPDALFDTVYFGLGKAEETKSNVQVRTASADLFFGGQLHNTYYDSGTYGDSTFNFTVGDIGPHHGFVVPNYVFSTGGQNFMPTNQSPGLPQNWAGPDMNAYVDWLKDLSDWTLANPRWGDRPPVLAAAFDLLKPTLSPLETYAVKETITNAYVEGVRTGYLANLKFRAHAGVRLVNTRQEASGSEATPVAFYANAPFQWAIKGVKWGTPTPVALSKEYSDVLPSLNLTFYPSDRLLTRVSVAKVMSRAPISALRLGMNQPNFSAGTVEVGNPDLKPFRALQYDATAEWYYSSTGAALFSVFYKDIDTFIANGEIPVTAPNSTITFTAPLNCLSANYCAYGWNGYSNGTPMTATYRKSGPFNSEGASIYGAEMTWQHDFGEWNDALSGLGIQFNGTYAESKTSLTDRFNNKLGIEGLSRFSYNLSTFYEKPKYGARIGYSWRSQFLQRSGDNPIYGGDIGWLDASAYWNISSNVTINAYGSNLLDSATKGTYGRGDGPYNDHLVYLGYSGRKFGLGIRAKY